MFAIRDYILNILTLQYINISIKVKFTLERATRA